MPTGDQHLIDRKNLALLLARQAGTILGSIETPKHVLQTAIEALETAKSLEAQIRKALEGK